MIPPWSTQEVLRQGMFVNVGAKLNGLFDKFDNTVGRANDKDPDAEAHTTLEGSGTRPFPK